MGGYGEVVAMARFVRGSVMALVLLLVAARVYSQHEVQEELEQTSAGGADFVPLDEPEEPDPDEFGDFGPLPAPIEWGEASREDISEYVDEMTEIKSTESVISMCDLNPALPACTDD